MATELKIIPLPGHVTNGRLFQLRRWANMLRGHYGLPVFLCGSALLENNPEPRDWDIRIEMPDKEFSTRFGDSKKWRDEGVSGEWTRVRWRWSDECVKQTKHGWKWTSLNIDFQIYPKSYCKEESFDFQPKARLDTRARKTRSG